MFELKSIKRQLILYLTVFASLLAVKDKDVIFLGIFAVIIFLSVLTESVILYFKTNSLRIAESSIITGMIIGFVVSAEEIWWKLAFVSVSAVSLKHLIRFRNKHIFNPAALGIFLSIIILGISTQWRGTYFWHLLTPGGIYFAWKTKKTEIITGYAVVSLILFGLQAYFQKVPLLNVFGYFSYFYIFIMVIEPKTSPASIMGKYLFGAATAVLVFIVTQIGIKIDAEILSLLVINLSVPLLDRIFIKKEVVE